MVKIKHKTYLEFMGFRDTDLVNPLHDKVCFWLEVNIEEILSQIIKKETKLMDKIGGFRDLAIKSKKWQKSFSKDNMILGFIDYCVDATFSPINEIEMEEGKQFDIIRDIIEIDNGLNIHCRCNFEIRIDTKSIGELIREINFCKEYCFGKFVVISIVENKRIEEILKNQDIGFLLSPSFNIKTLDSFILKNSIDK